MEIDDLTQAITNLGVASGVYAEALVKFMSLADMKPITMTAMEWAAVNCKKWMAIYSRTKKKRTKKKYRDRIINAWASSFWEVPNETMAK